MEWQLEFPLEVQAERELVIDAQVRAMHEGTAEAVREAQEMALAWLDRYPRDYGLLDAGEPIAMLADALALMAERGEAPPERVDYAKEMERWEAEWEQRQHAERVPASAG